MSGIEVQVDAAMTALRGLLGESVDQSRVHRSSAPSYPPTATGRDFAAQGAALTAMFEELHGGVARRIDAFSTTTEAAARQVGVYTATDGGIASTIDGIDGGISADAGDA